MFKQKLDSCAEYSCDNNLKSVIDYVFLTYFQHYKLYQFVLTQERADDITKVHLLVEPPRSVPVMREAIPKDVWDEEQRIKQIDQMEQERKQVCFQEHMVLNSERNSSIQEQDSSHGGGGTS